MNCIWVKIAMYFNLKNIFSWIEMWKSLCAVLGQNIYLYLNFYLNIEFFGIWFQLEITKGHVFDIWSIFENYVQIQLNIIRMYVLEITKIRQSITSHNLTDWRVKTACFSHMWYSGRVNGQLWENYCSQVTATIQWSLQPVSLEKFSIRVNPST